MEIEDTVNGIEMVTKSDLLGLDTWNAQRSREQLLGFVARRELALAEVPEDND